MRRKHTSQGLAVRAIAGTHAVLLAMDYPEARCPGLLGFGIHRTDHTEEEAYWLSGTKVFPSANPGLAPGSQVPTRDHPIQDFSWGDYSAKPGHTYTYRVVAFKGTPGAPVPVAQVKVKVTAESPAGGDHDIYFNRGTGASQAYARRFGNRKPGAFGGAADPAWTWLSRGCAESISDFVARAADSSWGLRVAAYELHEERVLAALAAAVGRGVDVLILHDADKTSPGPQNRAALAAAGIPDARILDRRTSAISHNKAIVLLHEGEPCAVLTGSTNFSLSGIYGHANAVHIVEDRAVARAYLDYWTALAANPAPKDLKAALSATPLPPLPPNPGTVTVFSPRRQADALDYYAALAGRASGALFMTFAFGMHDRFKAVYATGKAPLRYALFEKLLGPADRQGDTDAAMSEMIRLRRMVENRFAVGARIPGDLLDGWLHESLTGLSRNVQYIHTKYMLIDPLGDDPIVVVGSANFSKASSDANDENMLVIRDNGRVADVYLTEFMRLWEHFAFREWAGRANAEDRAKPRFLDETDRWWQRHFGGSALSRHREYFIS